MPTSARNPTEPAGALNGTHSDVSVGADAHIGPQPHGTNLVH